jgi:hypothetical protein
MPFKKIAVLILGLICPIAASARLGETETELVKRFGVTKNVSRHVTFAQGKSITLGPAFFFQQEDWSIQCDLIDGRCMRISYHKPGDWTEEQVRLVLNSNAQGAKWTETTEPKVATLRRTWKRSDGSTASWDKAGSMQLTWSAYDKARKAAEEKARVESASKKPKI